MRDSCSPRGQGGLGLDLAVTEASNIIVVSWSIQQVARMSGVTARTLRYYDEIGLRAPAQIGSSGYRYYEREQLLRLQQILLLRELDMDLPAIAAVVDGARDQLEVPARIGSVCCPSVTGSTCWSRPSPPRSRIWRKGLSCLPRRCSPGSGSIARRSPSWRRRQSLGRGMPRSLGSGTQATHSALERGAVPAGRTTRRGHRTTPARAAACRHAAG